MDGSDFLKPESMYAIMSWRFPSFYFFERCTEWTKGYFHLWPFFETSERFLHVVYPLSFYIMLFLFPYLAPKLFCFLVTRLFLCINPLPADNIFFDVLWFYSFTTPSWPLVSWLPHVSFSVSFHDHVAFRSEEREDGCGPVDEGWNSCWREEKLPSQFRKMTKKKGVCYKQ